MRKRLLIALLMTTMAAHSQIPEPPITAPTPTAFAFSQYGNFQVSNFTGIPSIKVPLVNVAYKKTPLDITLSYNSSGFRPDMHASTVGTGWNLNAGGVITRQVRGLPDEYSYYMNNLCKCIPGATGDTGMTYDLGFIKSAKDTTYSLANLENATYSYYNAQFNSGYTWERYPWPVPAKFHWWNNSCTATERFFKATYVPAYMPGDDLVYTGTQDLQSDEYSFNVFGHQGKFYFKNQGDIAVIADQRYTVNVAVYDVDIPASILQPNSLPGAGATCPSYAIGISPYKWYNRYPKALRGFTLTAEDGTRFTFGNRYDYTEAIDFSISENYSPGNAGHGSQAVSDHWIANAWYLSEVSFVDGRKIFFEYERGDYVRQLFNSEYAYSVIQNNPSCAGASAYYQLPGGITGAKIISPVYLKRIYSDLVDIVADYTTTGESNNLTANAAQTFAWRKLQSLTVKDYTGSRYKWKFAYSSAAVWGSRLFLDSVYRTDLADMPNSESWVFQYNDALTLPDYNTGYNDHWGYWNNVNTQSVTIRTNAQLDTLRNPSLAHASAGVLKRIIYPTGGYTDFDYELNSYRKKVKLQRDQGVDDIGANRTCGGLRIKSIISADTITHQREKKEYYYVTGYDPSLSQSQNTALPSSGVQSQNGFVYHWTDVVAQMFTYPTCLQNLRLSISSNQSLYPIFDSYQVGYSTVVEKYSDSSYKEFSYTNHDNGHADDTCMASINPFSSPYRHFSSRALERGKLTCEADFSKTGKLLKRVTTDYVVSPMDSSADPKTFIPQFTLNALSATNQTGGVTPLIIPMSYIFSDRYKEYNYFYKPCRVRTAVFQTNSADSMISEQTFAYENPRHNQPTKITQTTSTGKIITQRIKYSRDYPNNVVLNLISTFTLGSLPIERITTVKDSATGAERVVTATLNEYYQNSVSISKMPEIKNFYSINITSPFSLSSMTATVPGDLAFSSSSTWTKDSRYKKEMEFLKYDSSLNPVQQRGINGVHIRWLMGYNGLRPIGKLSAGATTMWTPAVTSFERDTVRLAPDDYFYPLTYQRDTDSFALSGTYDTTVRFTGKASFIGRARYIGSLTVTRVFVAVKSGGNIPFIEQYNPSTGVYTTSSAAATLYAEYDGWKVYTFAWPNNGNNIAINSNGNWMDELRMGNLSMGDMQSFETYTYSGKQQTETTDAAYRRTFYEYDNIGRLRCVRNFKGEVLKRMDPVFKMPVY